MVSGPFGISFEFVDKLVFMAVSVLMRYWLISSSMAIMNRRWHPPIKKSAPHPPDDSAVIQ